MNTLDTPNAQQGATPIWNTVLKYGAYCGGAIVVFSILTYLADVDLMSISGMLILYAAIFLIGFSIAAMAMKYQRDKLDGGVISYGKALAVGLLVVLIGMVISSFWNYILINFIDPEYMEGMKEQFIATWGESMPQESLDEALAGFDKAGNLFEGIKSSLIGGTIFGLIIGLITAAFMKREPMKEYMR
jgi:uncharacterized membrane protein (DUF106 family)